MRCGLFTTLICGAFRRFSWGMSFTMRWFIYLRDDTMSGSGTLSQGGSQITERKRSLCSAIGSSSRGGLPVIGVRPHVVGNRLLPDVRPLSNDAKHASFEYSQDKHLLQTGSGVAPLVEELACPVSREARYTGPARGVPRRAYNLQPVDLRFRVLDKILRLRRSPGSRLRKKDFGAAEDCSILNHIEPWMGV